MNIEGLAEQRRDLQGRERELRRHIAESGETGWSNWVRKFAV
ncbi:MAG: hypothetical protein U5J62_11655 [Desulfurivibrio sp.]|nr:hypothetical protein [Desulfurivibrio sp.]